MAPFTVIRWSSPIVHQLLPHPRPLLRPQPRPLHLLPPQPRPLRPTRGQLQWRLQAIHPLWTIPTCNRVALSSILRSISPALCLRSHWESTIWAIFVVLPFSVTVSRASLACCKLSQRLPCQAQPRRLLTR